MGGRDTFVSRPITASGGRKSPVILYSTYTFLKFKLQEEHIQTHYAWCSPTFEGAKVDKYARGSGQPGSSDPATIFRQLRKAVADCDGHDEKIAQQKKTIAGLAVSWFESKLVDEPARNEILAILEKATFADWRPLIFVIPYDPVAERTELVERAKRASHEPEYVIKDLHRGEFDIIEP